MLEKILPYLKFNCGQEFAFWIESKRIVYFARPLTLGVKWPAEIVLMQHLKQLGKNIAYQAIGCTAGSIMGGGMANHFKVNLIVESLAAVVPNPSASGLTFLEAQGAEIRSEARYASVEHLPSSPRVDLSAQGNYLHRLYLMAALRLIDSCIPRSIHLSSEKQARGDGHNIGALLVSRQGQVLATGLNSATCNKTYHAELNLLQVYAKSGKGMPAGSFLYSSLKPCDMCAAMITHLLPDCTVIYSQNDPNANGMTVPTGGMTALRNVHGAKQLKFVAPGEAKHYYDTMLDQATAHLKSSDTKDSLYYLTNIVDRREVRLLMSATQRGLVSKSTKYNNSLNYYGTEIVAKHPEVVRVLQHLAELLGFQAPTINPNWELLMQDLPEFFEMDLS